MRDPGGYVVRNYLILNNAVRGEDWEGCVTPVTKRMHKIGELLGRTNDMRAYKGKPVVHS